LKPPVVLRQNNWASRTKSQKDICEGDGMEWRMNIISIEKKISGKSSIIILLHNAFGFITSDGL
jgi:hypothetical protein